MSILPAIYSNCPIPLRRPSGSTASINWAAPINPVYGLQDSFEKVANVLIKPQGHQGYIVPGEVDMAGNIVQPGLNGRQSLGYIDSQGNYQLANGLRGNFFRDPYLQIIPTTLGEPYQDQANLLASRLKKAERQRAVNGSEIPLIRAKLTSKGIDGRGVKVGILDPLSKGKQGHWQPGNHSQLVARIINDPAWGVAPNAQTIDYGAPYNDPHECSSDNLLEYKANLIQQNCHPLNYTTSRILSALQCHDAQLRILNTTYVTVISSDYQKVLGHLQARDENGYYKYPRLRAAILGNTIYGSPKQQLIACQQFVDKTMAESPGLKQAYAQYLEATRQAAQAGIIIVVGVGNSNQGMPYNIAVRPGADLTLESRSPYVISVTASNTNQTPGYRLDDIPAFFSSRGDGYLWNPTIAAPGQELGITELVGNTTHNPVLNGTSFATPYVCGVIAMMLQQNPNLSFDQVKLKLQSTAVKSSCFTLAEVGAGFLNPEAAVLF